MPTRRALLGHAARIAAVLAAAGLRPGAAGAQAAPYNAAAFDAKSVAEALKAWGAAPPAESRDVTLTAPDIAENGAAVPLAAATTLAGARRLLLLVEKNPAALSALFDLSDDLEQSIATRVKMAQTSNVYAVAIGSDGRAWYAAKEVKVTLGGCGE